ncbi:MAG TPA: carboxypeptidase-like regulatory domain-containing protein [Bryobacteraceae bacterium]|jgi:hypothetical protein|nr:carboxypeptidase-like regulatory domain-containing protein [Bryobacteraceae bacterium]
MLATRRFLFIALLCSAPALPAQVRYFDNGQQLTTPPSNSKPEDRCVLQGRVTNALSGEPVRKASLRLTRQIQQTNADPGMQQSQGYSTTAGPDGTFEIDNIEPGDYRLSGERFGYLNSQYGAKNYGDRGTTITLRPGQQMTNINFGLTPQAVLTGKVVDQDGDPVPNVQVSLIGQMWQRGKLTHTMQNGGGTNDLGEFRMADVRPGKYYLLVQAMRYPGDRESAYNGKPEVRPVKTFYPEAPTLQSATALDVKAGQELSGMDVRMRTSATFHIRGKVVGVLPDGVNNRLNVTASAHDDMEMMPFMGNGAVMTKDRTFDVAAVPPGVYTLTLYAAGGPVRVMARQDVEVGQGDINDVELMIQQPGTLRGQISFEGNPPAGTTPANIKNVRVFLTSAEANRLMMGNNSATPADDGSFAIENVMPGKFYVQANPPGGTYLKSMRLGNQEMAGKDIELASGSGQLSLVYSYGVAEVDGTVQFPQESPGSTTNGTAGQASTPDASIVLIPDQLNEDGSGIHNGNSTSGGAFTLKSVPPGRYRAYAFETLQYGALQNPDIQRELASRGVDVELKENDRKQLQLNLITADEMNQIYSKLGIEIPQE